MIKILKDLSGRRDNKDIKGYLIIRHWHPSGGGRREIIKRVDTLEEAKEHCNNPETQRNTGPEQEQFFDGYQEE